MAVTRRTRIAPKEAEKPAEESTITRRRRPTAVAAPEAPAEAPKTRRRPVAKPSEELTQAIKIIESIAAPAAEPTAEPAADAPKADQIDTYDRIIREYKAKATTPKNAIRAHCMECMGGMQAEVRRCTSDDCALHPFRMGQNPFHALSKDNPNYVPPTKKENK